jgi:hypothetical protein
MRFTDEHQYGYSVEIWRRGDTVFGIFLAAVGLQGDTPTGLLEDVRFDSRSGRLAFRARLTTGTVRERGSDRNAKDLFEFEGVLRGQTVAGTLKHTESGKQVSLQHVRLRKQKVSDPFQPARYNEWQSWAEEILKTRGPRW